MDEVGPVGALGHQKYQHPALGFAAWSEGNEVEADHGRVDEVAGDGTDVARRALVDDTDTNEGVGVRRPCFAGLLNAVDDHAAAAVGQRGDVFGELDLLGLLRFAVCLRCCQRQLPLPVQVCALGHRLGAGSLNEREVQNSGRLAEAGVKRSPRHGSNCRDPCRHMASVSRLRDASGVPTGRYGISATRRMRDLVLNYVFPPRSACDQSSAPYAT